MALVVTSNAKRLQCGHNTVTVKPCLIDFGRAVKFDPRCDVLAIEEMKNKRDKLLRVYC